MTPTTIYCPRCHRGTLLYQKPSSNSENDVLTQWGRWFISTRSAFWSCDQCGRVQLAEDLVRFKRAGKLVQIPSTMRRMLSVLYILSGTLGLPGVGVQNG